MGYGTEHVTRASPDIFLLGWLLPLCFQRDRNMDVLFALSQTDDKRLGVTLGDMALWWPLRLQIAQQTLQSLLISVVIFPRHEFSNVACASYSGSPSGITLHDVI